MTFLLRLWRRWVEGLQYDSNSLLTPSVFGCNMIIIIMVIFEYFFFRQCLLSAQIKDPDSENAFLYEQWMTANKGVNVSALRHKFQHYAIKFWCSTSSHVWIFVCVHVLMYNNFVGTLPPKLKFFFTNGFKHSNWVKPEVQNPGMVKCIYFMKLIFSGLGSLMSDQYACVFNGC